MSRVTASHKSGDHPGSRGSVRERLFDLATRATQIGITPSDSDEERLRKALAALGAVLVASAGILWGLMYLLLGLPSAAAIPLAFTAINAITYIHFALTKKYTLLRFSLLSLILALPYALQWRLGGMTSSGVVMVWAFLAIPGALMLHGRRGALLWLLAFIALTAAAGIIEPHIAAAAAPLAPWLSAAFFVMNISAVATIVFLLMRYFVQGRDQAQERSERLLLNILPKPIADRLKRDPAAIADAYADVTVLFADIVDFTKFSAGISPERMVTVLNDVFSEFDRLAERHGREKIKTVGDAYMVVGGLPSLRPDHAEAVAEMALEMQDALDGCAARTGARLSLRIGINTGPVIAGVIGRRKFIYDLWGDTVNTASRMESHGLSRFIQVTPQTYERLHDKYVFESRGPVPIKGKGEMVTYLLVGRKAAPTL